MTWHCNVMTRHCGDTEGGAYGDAEREGFISVESGNGFSVMTWLCAADDVVSLT
jgi:hypothetical protein